MLPIGVRASPTTKGLSSLTYGCPEAPKQGVGRWWTDCSYGDYGAHRARAYRLYISLAYHWNEHGTWQGKRLRPSQPAALKYGLLRVFTPDDIAKMCYSPQTLEAMTKPSYRKYRHRAVEELQQMADEGALVLERGRTPEGADGYIILPPEGFGIPHAHALHADARRWVSCVSLWGLEGG